MKTHKHLFYFIPGANNKATQLSSCLQKKLQILPFPNK